MATEVIAVGRISVDLYSKHAGAGFDADQEFVKSVGGSPTNVAVAAARLGRSAAIVTKVGDDGFGQYVQARLREWGVDNSYVGIQSKGQTPLALTALDPPESPRVAFYRGVDAPDTTLTVTDVPTGVIASAGVLWISQATLARGSSAQACRQWMSMRSPESWTILDLDYRPALWSDRASAHESARESIRHASVVVGNLEECEVAVGSRDPQAAADALLSAGVRIAIVKLGAQGVLVASCDQRWLVPPIPVTVVSGVGAGDAFGGALCHGLLSGWDLSAIARFANAAGALVSSRLACAEAMPTEREVDELLKGEESA